MNEEAIRSSRSFIDIDIGVTKMKEFNIVVTGIGGQGSLTLGIAIAEAAMAEGYDVKTSELHGLAQRGGTIPCHVRFGDKIFSPLVLQGEAHLIIGLEPLEALRAAYYGSKEHKTVFVMDSKPVPPLSVFILNEKYPSLKQMRAMLKPFSKRVFIVNASQAVKKETGDTVAANIYLLGYAAAKKLLPLKKKYLLYGIEQVVPARHLEMNQRIFKLGLKAGKN